MPETSFLVSGAYFFNTQNEDPTRKKNMRLLQVVGN